MATPHPQTRAAIVDRYGALARAASDGLPVIDCGPDTACFGAAAYDDTDQLPEAAVRASLGCGNPTAVADMRPGDTVLDLGSGGGIDVLISARRVAPDGIAYGLDASQDMLTLARANAAQAGADNARFLHGHIEDIPLPDASIDVVISNCVINLSTDKSRVLREAHRVLRPGGRLGISDVLSDDAVPEADRTGHLAAEQRVGCVNGTLTAAEYHQLLHQAGFTDITITPTSNADIRLHTAIVQATKP
ncbi:methyltransferase domain-containing protein [Actinomadura decatromicini]|uniref:Arsenite methyltransferase n=1 Tax=Actinomadura decatromicini TaxID=2604572 RepID=A0A5D3FEP6_9ACTN|nr:methyltransferase domain-containing protein [Actinomadura decatromicini]TYK46693.1 methyltransferase domain-containing protein [Actinomadura decatromicini]